MNKASGSKALSESFTTFKQGHQRILAIFIGLVFNFYSLLLWIFVGFRSSNFSSISNFRLILLLSRVLLCLVTYLLVRRKPSWLESCLKLMIIMHFIWSLLDRLVQDQSPIDESQSFNYASNSTLLLCFTLLAKMTFRDASIIILMKLSLLASMLLFFRENLETLALSLFSTFFLGALFLTLGYFLHRIEDNTLASSKNLNRINTSEDLLKALFKHILPWAIIIASENEVIYSNNMALKVLSTSNRDSILEAIRNIKIREKNPEFRAEKHSKYAPTSFNKGFFGSKFSSDLNVKPRIKKASCSLNEFLFGKQFSRVDFPSTSSSVGSLGFNSFYGSFKVQSSLKEEPSLYHLSGNFSSNFEKKYFDITITDIIWENEKARLIILCEDDLIKRLKFLQRQTLFKDQLLGTVGHNLRTPLNGIIGMISSALGTRSNEKINFHRSEEGICRKRFSL